MINNFLFGESTKFSQNGNFRFQRDRATHRHAARIPMKAVRQIFGNRIISKKNGDIR